jgi:hypothetical protein
MEPITREEMLMDGQTLEPITREEKILAGENLEPITRREWFLKKYRGSGGDITIEDLYVNENGTTIAPSGVAYGKVVTDVPQPTIEELTITANGEYIAPSGKAYGKVTANVAPPSNAIYKQTLSNLPSPIATFTGADAPLDSLKASIEGVQSGSGEPSPQNVRPITGWTGCEVTDNNDTYTIPFKDSSDNPITVYGGKIDVTGGSWQKTYGFIEFDGSIDEQWQMYGSGSASAYAMQIPISDIATRIITSIDKFVKANEFTTIPTNETWGNYPQFISKKNQNLVVGNADITSLEVWREWLSTHPLQVKYELEAPVDYTFTPVNIRSDGVTNISVDCGEVTECKYFSDNP